MWTTLPLALALSLAPGQAEQLKITNDRVTYGLFGSVRPDTKFLPGDLFLVAFDIEGVRTDNNGKVLYSMGMEVTDSKGKTHYKQEPRDLEGINSLGGARLPAFAHVDIGTDQPPGEYTVKVTVTDRITKMSKTLVRRFEVLKKDFGIVRLNSTSDVEARMPAPPVGVVGQALWVNFGVVDFQRGSDKRCNVKVEMRIYDEKNKETLALPFAGDVNQRVPNDLQVLPMQYLLTLNRSGRFTVKLQATDLNGSKKPVEVSFPVTVLEAK
jgi:hypothetical protein